MATAPGVWGIEIGQSALKALRCSLVDGEVEAPDAQAVHGQRDEAELVDHLQLTPNSTS